MLNSLDRFGGLIILVLMILIAIVASDQPMFGVNNIRFIAIGTGVAGLAFDGLRAGSAWAGRRIRREEHPLGYWSYIVLQVLPALVLVLSGIIGSHR